MRQWIGLIIVGIAGYYLWTQYGPSLGPERIEPMTPDIEWYSKNIEHHFTIVPERGNAYFFRGFHANETTRRVIDVRVKVYLNEGPDDWRVLDTYSLGSLDPEERKKFDKVVRVAKDLDKPKLSWEIVRVDVR